MEESSQKACSKPSTYIFVLAKCVDLQKNGHKSSQPTVLKTHNRSSGALPVDSFFPFRHSDQSISTQSLPI